MGTDFDVFELISDMKPIGNAKYINNNEIRIEFEDRILILKEKKELNKEKTRKKHSVRSGYFENNITNKVKQSYCIGFKKEAIKELSQILNEHYKDSISHKALINLLKPHLEKYGYGNNLNDAIPAYIKYFVLNDLLKKNGNIFEIVRSNLIPKKEKESRGFLDELEMS